MEIAVIAILLLLALSTLRFIGKIFSFIVGSFIKLVVMIVFIIIVILGLDYYGIDILGKIQKSDMIEALKIEKIMGS